MASLLQLSVVITKGSGVAPGRNHRCAVLPSSCSITRSCAWYAFSASTLSATSSAKSLSAPSRWWASAGVGESSGDYPRHPQLYESWRLIGPYWVPSLHSDRFLPLHPNSADGRGQSSSQSWHLPCQPHPPSAQIPTPTHLFLTKGFIECESLPNLPIAPASLCWEFLPGRDRVPLRQMIDSL